MQLATQSTLNMNAARLISIPGYTELKARLDISIVKVDKLAKEQLDRMLYRANAKNLARKKAGDYTLDLVSKLQAFALISDNIRLHELSQLTATEISRSTDNELIASISNRLDYGNENLEALAGYGVTAEWLAEGADLFDAYKAEIDKLRLNKNALTSITQQLEKQLRSTLGIIHIVDALIETRRVSDPQLYGLYWSSRAKQNTACTKVSVKGRVFRAETGEALPGAILTVERATDNNQQTAGNEPIRNIRIRSDKGRFRFRLLTTGKYIFKVTYAGCQPGEFIVYFNEGNLTHVELPLIRIE
jgi:hypothetical protein